MTFEVSDFFAPSSFNGSHEPRTPLRKFLFSDCTQCRELNEAFFSRQFHVDFSMISYWLEVKPGSIRGAIGIVSRYDVGYDSEWGFTHDSFVKFSDDGKTLRRGGDPRELESCKSLIARGDTSPQYPQILHLMNDHYDQAVLEKLVNNPGWIPNGCYGWFEDLPKRMLPSLPDRKP